MRIRRVLLLILLTASTASAQTIVNVPSAGHPTIQSALNAASGGELILVAPGT